MSNLTRVAFTALTLVGEYWKGGLVVNGVVEICPRSPPNLLAIGDEVLITANGTIRKTLDFGSNWSLGTDKDSSLTPVVPAAPWLRKIWPDARWMDVQPVAAYVCWSPGHTGMPCAANGTILADPKKEYIDWGVGDMLHSTLGRPRPNRWIGLPAPVSEFCTSCGGGVQLRDGSYVYLVVVWFGPNWRADNHSLSAPCCNNSVLAFTSPDGLDWRYSGTVAAYNESRAYQEGPNECDVVLLKDGKTLFAVMRVDGGDGRPDGRTLPLIAATSTDGGVTWVPAATPQRDEVRLAARRRARERCAARHDWPAGRRPLRQSGWHGTRMGEALPPHGTQPAGRLGGTPARLGILSTVRAGGHLPSTSLLHTPLVSPLYLPCRRPPTRPSPTSLTRAGCSRMATSASPRWRMVRRSSVTTAWASTRARASAASFIPGGSARWFGEVGLVIRRGCG